MISKCSLESAGQGCADYLIHNIRDDGSFVYEQNSRTGFISPNYNMLRHSGAIYALCEWLRSYKNPKALKAVEKALDYLKGRIIPLQDDLLCVEEEGEIKLGGAALSLLALIEYHKLRPLPENIPVMQGLAKFICWMQDGTGRFRSKLSLAGSISGNWVSTYYPGQAILALTRLYLTDKDLTWLVAAEHGAMFLINKYNQEDPVRRPYNHWLCIAIAELHPILPNNSFYKQYWLLANTVIDSVRPQKKAPRPYSSAQMATRGEALLAGLLLEVKLGNHLIAGDLATVLDGILQYCLNYQIKENSPYKRYFGGIIQGNNGYNIRIDYVQHTLSVVTGVIGCSIPEHKIYNPGVLGC
jgi:hypothetical protein